MTASALNKHANFILLAYWLLGAAGIVGGGLQPDGYWLYVHGSGRPWSYPVAEVIQLCGIALVEALMVAFVLRLWNYQRSWGRALSAVVVLLGMIAFWGLSLMHAPNFVFMHALWLVLGLVFTLGLLVVSLIK
jgi:hypothetical protein